jgi:hypothetical protein
MLVAKRLTEHLFSHSAVLLHCPVVLMSEADLCDAAFDSPIRGYLQEKSRLVVTCGF